MNRSLFSLALAAGLLISPLAASAQTYPGGPVAPTNPSVPNYSYPDNNQPGQDDEQMQNGPQQDPDQGAPQQYAPQQPPQASPNYQYQQQPQYQPGQGVPPAQGYQNQQYAPAPGQQYAPGNFPPATATVDPVMRSLQQAQRARRELQKVGDRDLAGHRAQAQMLLDQAIQELKACQYYETH